MTTENEDSSTTGAKSRFSGQNLRPPLGIPPVALPGQRRAVRDILVMDLARPDADRLAVKVISSEAWMNKHAGTDAVDQARDVVKKAGATEQVAKVTARIQAGGLDRIERLLLSVPGVYARLVQDAVEGGEVQLDDTIGFEDHVRRALNAADGPRGDFIAGLVQGAIDARGVTLEADLKKLVVDELLTAELSLRGERTETDIFAVIERYRSKGGLAAAVEYFVRKSEVDPTRFTDAVRRSMIAYLERLGLNFTVAGLNAGNFDEYLALAYHQALSAGNGGSADPIDAVRQKGTISDWDFTVDTFEGVEEQGVIPANIMAAGALDYIYNLGEVLGMFRLADTVVLRWGSGAIDLDPGETSSRLYRYWKLRSERTSPEDRGMLYKRVLNKSDGEILEGAVVNERFPELWGALMQAVADYIERVEEKKTEENSVSRQRVYQATRQLQYNLTEFATGMAHMQINEMYHHLQEAREILEDPQIVDYFGSGRRKTIWTVIERGSKEWFEATPNIAAVRDAAVEGNKVFQWIARFDQTTVTDQEFFAFKDAAEAWILAQASMGEAVPLAGPSEEEETTDEDEELVGSGKDEFDADWDQ